eukprot:scaffold665288_cov50-Prasinocladus_malaysianus.AAC.2
MKKHPAPLSYEVLDEPPLCGEGMLPLVDSELLPEVEIEPKNVHTSVAHILDSMAYHEEPRGWLFEWVFGQISAKLLVWVPVPGQLLPQHVACEGFAAAGPCHVLVYEKPIQKHSVWAFDPILLRISDWKAVSSDPPPDSSKCIICRVEETVR